MVPEVLELSHLEHVADVGSGGYGTVMLMRDKRNDRPIAIKCLRRDMLDRAKVRARVLSEKRLMVEVNHPFIVQIIGTFKDSERLFIGMEFATGGELYQYMQKHAPMPRHEVSFVTGSITLMLEHIHAREFIYRDLKPENLLIDNTGHLKLVDFGFCKELPKSERTFTNCGTLEYMAPEFMILSRGQGPEIDWWALGVLVYECFHGATPYMLDDPDISEATIIGMIRDPTFVDQMHIDEQTVPPDAAALIRGCMTYLPELRFDGPHLKACDFFANFDWEGLLQKKLRSLGDLVHTDPFDTSAFDPEIDPGFTGAELLALPAVPYVPETGAWDANF